MDRCGSTEATGVLPRVVATDLDGTLLRPDGTVSERTRAALREVQDAGVLVVVCTARPVRWMRGLAEQCGIPGAAVCANGGVLWDLGADALLSTSTVAPAVGAQVVDRLRTVVPGTAWAVEGVDSFGHEPAYEVRWPLPDDTVVADVSALLARAPVKLLARRPAGSDPSAAVRARDAVAGLVELTWSEPSAQLLEMTAAGVSKASGLATLCGERGIVASDVIAFGDMPNDLSMLRFAGCGYAMGNAHPELAAAADARTASNADDGVALVLERLLREAR